MVVESKSMNDEERQYWLDVMPIMTEEQVANLRNILENEIKERAAADQAYQKGVNDELKKVTVKFDEIKYNEKKKLRKEEEAKHEEEETKAEEELLKEIENM